jgi:hypothetical protein
MSARPRPKKKDRHPGPRPPRVRPRALRASAKRSAHARFTDLFSPRQLTRPLPLLTPQEEPPLSPTRFRSWYRPHSPHALRRLCGQLKARPTRRLALLALAFYLVDFSPLRPLLLALTTDDSARGERPFDPLSLLLLCLWKVCTHRPWSTLAADLAHPEQGALWRRLCGFSPHDTPSESTLRAFRDRLFPGFLNYVQKLFLAALDRAGLLPPLADMHGYLLVGDGQLHQARSQSGCHQAVTSCFSPAPRPCPRREKTRNQSGCACATPLCQERCLLAARRDPQARFILYSRREKKTDQTTTVLIETAVFGYRSQATRLVDPRFHCAWNVHSDLFPANADEGVCFRGHFLAAYSNLPQKALGYALYDSACGEQQCLDTVYDLGGIPLFDLLAAPGDDSVATWKERGYDDHGHPFCHLGFPMTCQGLDRSRQQPRTRWVCLHSCRQSEQGAVADCPYLAKRRGQYLYIERTLPDGSYRLARLVPHGTPLWDKLTAWRNTSEGRNSNLQARDLLRFPDYGLPHAAFLVLAADLIENLCTLARLVYEATLLDPHFQPLREVPVAVAVPPTQRRPTPSSAQQGQPAKEVPTGA